MIPPHPNCKEGYRLFHEGLLALSEVEQTGIPIDVSYCEKQFVILDKKIQRIKRKLGKTPEVKQWKKKHRGKFNLDSNDQLADMLFNQWGYEPKIFTAKGRASTSQEALEQIDSPIVAELTTLGRLSKSRNTYLKNFLLEQVDGILHPFFNLHIAQTFRSSSSAINFQNIPTRIPEIKKLVRQAIKPLPGYMIVEIDFSGVEVRIAGCYNKDPNLIQDIIDPTRDMHRDMAMECYMLDLDEVTKQTRYNGKNKFVFPQFYGDYYVSCARALWDAIHLQQLTTQQGVPLKKHLRKKGIASYEKFETHIKSVEDYFWGERFKVYSKWKENHWETYQKNGYVDLMTGFRCQGVMSRNQAINYPIQGSAFHCLLWCLITLHKWLKKINAKTKIIGQIHDSIVMMVHPNELNKIMKKAYRIMEKEIRAHWPWIIVPLEVETEASPIDGSWYLKKEIVKEKCLNCQSHWVYKETKQCPVCGGRNDL